MATAFEQLLQELSDAGQPLPLLRLSELSDLDDAHMAQLEASWPSISVAKRRRLMEELGQLADRRIELTFERINRLALTDPDGEVRRSAISNLWECEDPWLVPPLVEALEHDPVAPVRAAAAERLGRFVLLGEVDRLPTDLLRSVEEALLRGWRLDAEADVRLRCLESLGYSSRKEASELIEAAYSAPEEDWVRSALLAMGRSANERWKRQVLAELNSPVPSLRLEAVKAAGELELKEATSELIQLLEDAREDVRRAAIWSLGQLGGSEAADALLALLETSEDGEEARLLEDALDNLAFVEGTPDFLLAEYDEPEDTRP